MENFVQKLTHLTEWKKYDLAIKEVNNWLSQDPENAEAYGWLGYIKFLQGDFKSCIIWSEKSLSIDQDDASVFLCLADSYRLSRKGKKAQEVVDHAIERFPNFAPLFAVKAELELKEMQYRSALKHVNNGLSLTPENTNLLNIKARILKKLDMDGAEELLDQSLSIDPMENQTFNEKGWLALGKRKYGEAEDFFLKSLQLDPNDQATKVGHLWSIKANYYPKLIQVLLYFQNNRAILGIAMISFILLLLGYTIFSKLMGNGSWLFFFLMFYGFLLSMKLIGILDILTTAGLEDELKEKKHLISEKDWSKFSIKIIRFIFVLIVFSILLYFHLR